MKKKDVLERDAPALMSELTKEFVTAKDLNARAKVRARMKAVLDFCSVDTSYPDIDGAPWAQPNPIGFGQYDYAHGNTVQQNGVQPIPGADNTI